MRKQKNDLSYIWDMVDSAKAIQSHIANRTYYDFTNNRMLQKAIERELEIIGEAANHVSQPHRDEHPEIPWPRIINQRNIIIHEYDDIR